MLRGKVYAGKKIYIMANFKQRPFILLEHYTFFFRKALLAANMQNGFTWFALSDLMTSGLTL